MFSTLDNYSKIKQLSAFFLLFLTGAVQHMFNLSVAGISSMPKSIYCTVFRMVFLSGLRLALERRESMFFFFTLAPISPMYVLLRLCQWSLAPTALGTTTQQNQYQYKLGNFCVI